MTISDKIREARTIGEFPPDRYIVQYKNIGDLLLSQAARFPQREWLAFYSDANAGSHEAITRCSYGEFRELAGQMASLLRSFGIQRGDKVATVAHNHADTVIQYFGAWLAGAVVVPINVGEDDKRIGYILKNSDAKIAFVRTEYLERMKRIISASSDSIRLVRVGGQLSAAQDPANATESPNHDEFQQSLRGSSPLFPTDVSLEDEALIVYTSGTTGNPKGVVLTQYNLLADAKAISEWHGMTPGERMMCVLPIHHVNGTVVTLLTPLYYGGSVVLNQKFHSAKFFERLANEKVQVVSVVPTLLQFLLHENPDLASYDLSAFRHIICGAGPLTVELAMNFEGRFHLPIVHGYGLSETTCYSCFLPLDLSPNEHQFWLREHGFPSIGVPLPINEMSIHDENGDDVAEGSKGEIVIRGHNVMKEYHANPEANGEAFKFSWFRSGDEGFFRKGEKGRKYFFITGRIKELIIRGGSNISPFEIDEVLMNIPGVKAGLAVGFENDWYGEEVGAYVQLSDGAGLNAEEIIAACRKSFSFAKSPKVVVFGSDIPVTSTGKYQRNRLKPLFAKWKEVQFKEMKSP